MAMFDARHKQDDSLYATLGPSSSSEHEAIAPAQTQAYSAYGRYVLVRPHAEGGLGEVFLASDQEIGREVALKQIRGCHADDPGSQGRFVREAEITGNLEHPGIVPVYGFGRSPDGRPYYAMRFIRGESLEDAIARFHEAETPDRDHGARAMERIRLLKRFSDVCDTMEYAHSRGIIHRDLKPSNIMLGAHGETLVVDWGLAKPIHAFQEAPDSLPRLDPAAASDQTLPGSPMGTPAYMSPEQAAGCVGALRPASDVYNLGATLYCLLTGRPPFGGGVSGEMLEKIQKGDFPRPSAVAQGPVPRALEAVCLKAMATEPGNRYASPRALADEILRWVADEPVSAYTETRGERLRRWSRRHKTWVRGGTIVLSGLFLVMMAATYLVNRAWLREQATRVRAEHLSTSLMLDQGLNLCELGATGSGLLWLAHAQKVAPPEARALRETILANLAAWQEASGTLRMIIPHVDEVLAVAFRPDGLAIVTGGSGGSNPNGQARLWDAATGRPLGPPLLHPGHVIALSFSPDGKTLLTGCSDAVARVWDPVSGRSLGEPMKQASAVSVVMASPDGHTFLTADGRSIRLWDATTHRLRSPPFDHPDAIKAAAFSPDGSLLLTGCQDSLLRLWNIARLEPDGPPVPHDDPVNCVAFSPDGRTFMAGGAHGNVRFWETATRQRFLHRVVHRSEVTCVAYSPDGKTAVTGSGDNTAALWDPATGLPLGQPLEHRGTVRTVAFSPDGKTILTGGSDAAARLWDPPDGKPLRAVARQPGRVLAVAAGPGGKAWPSPAPTGRP